MNLQRYLLSTVAMFVFVFLYEIWVHGFVFIGMYEATAQVWRDFSVMEANMPLAMGFQLVLSAWTAFIFTQMYKEGGVKNGLLFGLFLGVFAGILMASWYLWLNVPVTFSLIWLVSSIGEGLGSGLILGLVYHGKHVN